MLIIRPVQSKEKQAELCELCGIEFRSNDFAYAAYVSGNVVGMSQFSVCDEFGTVNDLVPAPGTNDLEALFIMGRQTMNWIDLLGVHTCQIRSEATSDVLIGALGFRKDESGIFTADTTHMFEGNCGGHCDVTTELQKEK